jgi:Putative zinc-finger
MRCDEMRELAPDIALGIADGEERAEALEHLSTCGDCRRHVAELSQVADELLMLAPVQDPPAGFESRVAQALGLERPPRRRLARWLTPRWLALRLGPPLAAAAVAVAALVTVYHDDRQTAERYRDALARAGGEYFLAEPLADERGTRGGVAFGYEGRPSWIFVTVDPEHRDAVARGELVTRDGRTIALPRLDLDRTGSWGGALPVNLYKVASLRLLGDGPEEVLETSFPRGESDR